MNRVLITGATGYLGCRLVEYLKSSGDWALVASGRSPEFLERVFGRSISFVRHDALITGSPSLDSFDQVVHLAAMDAPSCKRDPAEAYRVNALGTKSLLEACTKSRVKRFVYVSTVHVYGFQHGGMIDESTPTRATHPYAWSHAIAENHVLENDAKGLIEGIVVRLSNSFGFPGHSEIGPWDLVVNSACRQIAEKGRAEFRGHGSDERDFIALGDVVRGIAHLLGMDLKGSSTKIFNLCEGRTLSMEMMVDRIVVTAERLFGKRPSVKFAVTPSSIHSNWTYSNRRLIDSGFHLTHPWDQELEETLRRCKEWFA